MRLFTSFLALLFMVGGCAGTADTILDDKDLVDIATTSDQLAPADTLTEDLSSPADLLMDFGGIDLLVPETVDTVEPGCEPGQGCFLDKCTENGDCLSGWCVEHLGEGVCSQPCQAECPPGWECQQVAGTDPDVVYICVSNHANLCRPCNAGSDCKSVGGAEDVCVDYGEAGSFCGGTCAVDDDCPWGFSCVEALTVDGIETSQCVADAGECPCTEKSVSLSLWTACASDNEFGTCQGKRVCSSDGLTGCDAPTPAPELCNGIDDNCDGNVDEATCDDGNDCTEDACLGDEGCQNLPLDLGECKDGNPCTVADHCEAGVCVGDPVICDDQNPCTEDLCTEQGGCEHLPAPGDCDDGDPCTLGDHCSDSECVGEAVACDCQSDSDCGALEDGDLCNGTLYCDQTSVPYLCKVKPDSPVECPQPEGDDAPCLVASCNPDNGSCSLVPANDGNLCDDADQCTLGDTCLDGECTPGAAVNCNDGNLCTDDECVPESGCTYTHNSAPCSDGDVCTVSDVCANGDCAGSGALACDDGNVCTDDACDSEVGCIHTHNQAVCDDGNACTTNDQCGGGSCVGGTLLDCNDDNGCTTDTCTPEDGCIYTFNTAPCTDSNACTLTDQCALGECVGSGNLVCNDGNPCTDDACDSGVGCQFVPNSAPCDDGNECTENDQCQLGGCKAGTVVNCDDSNICTDDSCDIDLGCQHVNNTNPCSDDDACTLDDTCADGDCVGGPALQCDDNNLCTNDGCDAQDGCVYQFNTEPCDDSDPCTVTDACDNGSCQGSGNLDCDDNNACTQDSCETGVGCQHLLTVDYQTDDNNCGQCGKVCGQDQECNGGECTLIDPWVGAGASWSANGKYFGRYTWSQANTSNNGRSNAMVYCTNQGGTLARPNSQVEWDKLYQNIPNDSMGYWMDGHNNYQCGTATPGNPKSYQYGLMYCPTGTNQLYTGCNCTNSEQGLVVYRYSGSGHFDGCQSYAGGGNLGAMDESLSYDHNNIKGFVCEK